MIKLGGIYKLKKTDTIIIIVNISKVNLNNEYKEKIFLNCFELDGINNFSNQLIISELNQLTEVELKEKNICIELETLNSIQFDGYLGQIDDKLLIKLIKIYEKLNYMEF